MNVLVIDDDPKFRRYVRQGLEESRIECTVAADATQASARLGERRFDLILLDVMMPGRSGWDFLDELRARDETPVIFVTARHSVDERVRGLELGADDYIIKPFEFRELLARMDAVLRRRRPRRVVEFGDLRVDMDAKTCRRGERVIDTSPRDFELLCALIDARGRVLSRADALKRVWNIDFDPGTNVVDVQIGRLRRKLDCVGPPLIETVVGQGYRLRTQDAP